MHDSEARKRRERQKEQIKRRYNVVIDPENYEYIFYMYLYGYSTQQIADALTKQGRNTYFGKTCWSSSGIVSILRNERHCGDILTRKTITENYRTHRSLKNRGEKPQSRYYNHHDAIIRRDDFNAVQRMLDNAKYGNTSILPELRVIHCVHFVCCGKVLHNLDILSELNNLIQLVNFTASAYKVSLALPFFLYALSPKQGLRS